MEGRVAGQNPLSKFTLKQLEVFAAVAELSSFTRAAETLYLTQSTVSAHIGALERGLGTQLFIREARRKVCLTAEGKRVYPAVQKILLACKKLEELADSQADGPPLHLGASTVPAQYLLPGLLSQFLKRYPEGRFVLKRGDSGQIHDWLQDGEIRIGFVGTLLEPGELEYAPLAEDKLVVITENSARFRALQSQGAYGQTLLREPFVAREEGSGTDRSLREYLRQMEFPLEQLRVVARVDNPETIKSMVAQGAGVSVLSSLSVEQAVAAGQLLSFEMEEKSLRRTLYMVWRRNLSYSSAERRFLAFIRCRGAAKTAAQMR